MARKKSDDSPAKVDNLSEINRLISKFLHEVAEDFSEFSDPVSTREQLFSGYNKANALRYGIEEKKAKPQPAQGVQYETEREVLIEVLDKYKDVVVIGEFPRVRRDEITIKTAAMTVQIEIRHQGTIYKKKIELGCSVNPEARSTIMRNGILEIVFQKAQPSNKTANLKISE